MMLSQSDCTQSVHLGTLHFQRSEDRLKQGETRMARCMSTQAGLEQPALQLQK